MESADSTRDLLAFLDLKLNDLMFSLYGTRQTLIAIHGRAHSERCSEVWGRCLRHCANRSECWLTSSSTSAQFAARPANPSRHRFGKAFSQRESTL